ncbi:MAG: hypothetical protein ACLFVU_11565 [Phycisphaerae bacterium]
MVAEATSSVWTNLAAWAGVAVGLGALMVSIIALLKGDAAKDATCKLQKEANETQNRVAAIEEAREANRLGESMSAVLRARIDRGTRTLGSGQTRPTFNLVVANEGQGEARGVEVTMDGKPLLEHPAIPKGEEEVSLIGAGGETSWCLALSFGCAPPFEIEICWDDDDAEGKTYKHTLK